MLDSLYPDLPSQFFFSQPWKNVKALILSLATFFTAAKKSCEGHGKPRFSTAVKRAARAVEPAAKKAVREGLGPRLMLDGWGELACNQTNF